MRPQYSVRKRLAQIYRAKDCTDLTDVENALAGLRQLAMLANGHYTATMRRRLASLTERKQYFELKKATK